MKDKIENLLKLAKEDLLEIQADYPPLDDPNLVYWKARVQTLEQVLEILEKENIKTYIH